jgi:iron-sulfur cluster insertion protein
MMKLTAEALEFARAQKKIENADNCWDLRLYITGKGCDGFFYGITWDALIEGKDLIVSDEISPLRYGFDKESYAFLKDVEIQFIDDERGRGFWVHNPDHEKFEGKFYKKPQFESWYSGEQTKVESISPDSIGQ